jgi:hypothetical protein
MTEGKRDKLMGKTAIYSVIWSYDVYKIAIIDFEIVLIGLVIIFLY